MNRLKSAINNQAVRGTAIVTAGLFVSSVFSYLLQFFLGRMLTVPEYGVFNALLALFTVLAVFSNTFMTSLIKVVSELKVRNDSALLTGLFTRLSVYIVLFGLGVFSLIYMFSSEISSFLKVDDLILVSVFGIYMGISFLSIIPSAYLQGLLRFREFSVWTILGGIVRFAFPVLFVFMGYSVGGVYLGLALAVIVSYGIALLFLRKDFSRHLGGGLKRHYRRLLVFIGPVLFVNVGMSMLNNADIILVKHYLSSEAAGIYSGVVTLGKILLFGAGTVGVVMFPQVSSVFVRKGDYFERFKPFLVIQVLIIAAGALVFGLFPKLITLVFFGERFLPAVEYLPRFTIFVSVYVLVNFLILFFLAIEKTKVFLLQVPAVVGQFVLISLFHKSISQVINVNIGVSVFLLMLVVVYYLVSAGFHNSSRV